MALQVDFGERIFLQPPEPAPGPRVSRRLRVFAVDPTVRRSAGQLTCLSIPFEPLQGKMAGRRLEVFALPGPFGQRGLQFALLDEGTTIAQDGVAPGTTDPQFAQQMVYAVSIWTLERFRSALGREPDFAFDGPLSLQPHAMEEANAYYDRTARCLRFGWFRQKTAAPGATQKGALICTAMSHDVVVHEMSHALLDGMRSHLLVPTNPDVLAFHEGFADLVALFAHFTHKDLVRQAIEDSKGDLNDQRLIEIGKQFGQAINGSGPLRTSILDPVDESSDRPAPINYENTTFQAHERGSILVSAVFEAFRKVYLRKTRKWRNLAASVPMLSAHPVLIDALTKAAAQLAEQFLNIVIRALDYLPPVDITFGEYLRAMITADYDLVPEDPWDYREALIYAFRRYGISVSNVEDLSERELLWRPAIELGDFKILALRVLARLPRGVEQQHKAKIRQLRAKALKLFVLGNRKNLAQLGLLDSPDAKPITIESVRSLNRVGPNGDLMSNFVVELVQWRHDPRMGWIPGGCTLIIGASGELHYVILKSLTSPTRLAEMQLYLDGVGLRYASLFRAGTYQAVSALASEQLKALHLACC